MDFATIHSAEYADFLMKKGTPEQFDQIPVGTGSFQFVDYQKDAVIRFKAFDGWAGKPKIDDLSMPSRRIRPRAMPSSRPMSAR